jgi:uroporphyrinogen decarboxylase
MTPKERILKAIRHEEPDRVPLNVWLYRDDVAVKIVERYGSVDAFFDEFGIDMYTIFAPLPTVIAPEDCVDRKRPLRPDELDKVEFNDPTDDALYEPVRQAVRKYGIEKQRAVFCQIGAVFEGTSGYVGIESHLLGMATHREELARFYRRLAEWLCVQAEKVISLGIDVLHISDDWGQNDRMLFSPRDWWDLVYPNDKMIVDVGKRLGVPVSLHSDGYITDVLDGVVKMGVDVLHPVQESAGMDQATVKERYGDRLTIYGGLDITHFLPFADEQNLVLHVKNRMDKLKPGGGFIFCTAHSVQPEVTLDRLELAYRTALEHGKY